MALSAPEQLTAAHQLDAFRCGKPILDRWLQTRGLRNQELGFTAVMVVHEAMRVAGYYGMAPGAIVPDILPRSVRTRQPPNPVPCILLGQFAVDQDYRGRGIGDGLLTHALSRAIQASHLIGGRVVVVHAVDDEAAGYWRFQGFLPTVDDPLKLFRSIADIGAALRQSGRMS